MKYLTSLQKTDNNKKSHPALNYDLFLIDLNCLIDKSNQVINRDVTSYYLQYALQQIKKPESAPTDIEFTINILKSQKAKFSALLAENAETKSEESLLQLEKITESTKSNTLNK